ncbi:MAG: DUF2510 domain-containing protein [Acidimicrobiales bacterium]
MQEFTTVSSSSYDPASLATKLTDKSAEGWTVVSIVSTGGDVTAFLSRESSGVASALAAEAPAAAVTSGSVPVVSGAVPVVESAPAPAPEPAVSEPAGWAVAPEPQPATTYDPQPAATSYTPAAATYTPAAAAPAAAATPAVPAGWYADPAGRFELRYWDGGTWTEHVSRAGQQYTDPPVA